MAEEKEPMIYKAISAVMEDVGAVGKDSVNKQQGFKFRGIDAVMNALNPALVKNKVFVIPEVLEQHREERTTSKSALLIYSICKVKYTFFTTDGSSVCATVIGEGMDSGDKATNKAMSIAFKYACFQVFCIPTEELLEDPDKEIQNPAPKKPNSKNNSAKTVLATDEQIHKIEEFVTAYAGLCESSTEAEIWDWLKKTYKFEKIEQVEANMAEKILKTISDSYGKKAGANK